MSPMSRRPFLLASAVGIPLLIIHHSVKAEDFTHFLIRDAKIATQKQREQVLAFFEGFYTSFDSANVADLSAYFVKSTKAVFGDATTDLTVIGYTAIKQTFTSLLSTEAAVIGPGKLAKLFHVAGDLNYGAVTERVELKNVFYATNGNTVQTLYDFDNHLIARFTDYADSRELGLSDIVGPANTTGVGVPAAPIHPGGVPRSSTTPASPGNVALTTGVTGAPSASPEMVRFVQYFHDALSRGSLRDILSFFTPDAVYVNPLLHQGPVLYGNFDQTIQIEGLDRIAGLFSSAGDALPDCRESVLLHIVGGSSGGGFEWKAGGRYGGTGINRDGLTGCTSLDLFDWRIRRMSVKFDTFQLPLRAYDGIRSALARTLMSDY